MKKLLIAVFLAIILFPAEASDTFSIFSVDLGYMCMDENGTFEAGPSISLNYKVTESLTAAFELQGINVSFFGDSYIFFGLLKLKYDFSSFLRATIGTTVFHTFNDPDDALYLGFEAIPYKRNSGGLSTEIKFIFEMNLINMMQGTRDLRWGITGSMGF